MRRPINTFGSSETSPRTYGADLLRLCPNFRSPRSSVSAHQLLDRTEVFIRELWESRHTAFGDRPRCTVDLKASRLSTMGDALRSGRISTTGGTAAVTHRASGRKQLLAGIHGFGIQFRQRVIQWCRSLWRLTGRQGVLLIQCEYQQAPRVYAILPAMLIGKRTCQGGGSTTPTSQQRDVLLTIN